MKLPFPDQQSEDADAHGGGADDIRVAVLEDYLLDRALHELGVPSTLLDLPRRRAFAGKNPWHGKIKVREELKWLEKYGGQ